MLEDRKELTITDEYFKAIKDGQFATVERMVDRKSELVNAKNESGMSGVVVATYFGQPKIADFLISHGANMDLFEAAMVGKVDTVRRLVGADPETAKSFARDGFTALHLASFFGNIEAARFLVQSGADVNAAAKNAMKVMPLHSAVARNQYEISELLISSGAKVNSVQEGGFTPLHAAAQNGNTEIAELLLKNGANVNAKTDEGRTPLALTRSEGREAGPKEKRDKVASILRQQGGKE